MRRAVDVCAVMMRQALEPDMVTYNALISACGEGRELRRALDVCADMMHHALKPNLVSV